jgi:glycerophosphoryl diester phosphodiesterase
MRLLFVLLVLISVPVSLVPVSAEHFSVQKNRKILVAHRGASSYAPEHTLAAYRLALSQGADYVEQDLQISKDGVLVCLHDLTLERTTDVEEVFPDRARTESDGRRRWYVSDFMLEELKRLDAGAWFDEKFRGERIPTFQEALDVVRGRAGIYPETKGPEVYGSRGFNMERLVLEFLKKNKLDRPGADPRTPVIIQSFSADSLKRMAFELKTKLPLVFLINSDPGGKWLAAAGLKDIKTFASGIGPAKNLIENDPDVVKRAHAAGLTVTPYTFRSGATGKYRDVRQEMHQFLYTYGVDALFTDNPDQFPRER